MRIAYTCESSDFRTHTALLSRSMFYSGFIFIPYNMLLLLDATENIRTYINERISLISFFKIMNLSRARLRAELKHIIKRRKRNQQGWPQ